MRTESGELRMLLHALGVVRDNGERIEYKRHAFAPQRRECAVGRLSHMKVQVWSPVAGA